MVHKRFQLNYPEGGIEVQFNLEFDGKIVTVHSIQIHSNFHPSGLPYNPTLKNVNGKWNLYTSTGVANNQYTDDIVNEIIRLKEEETPRFS